MDGEQLARELTQLSFKVEVSGETVRVKVEPGKVKEIMHMLKRLGIDLFLSLTAVDEPNANVIKILYHLTSIANPRLVVVVETSTPRDKLVVQSIADIYPAAQIQEREEHEMLGVVFEGNPDLRRLLLPPDWPKDTYPLRKDFKVVEEPFMATRQSKPIRLHETENGETLHISRA